MFADGERGRAGRREQLVVHLDARMRAAHRPAPQLKCRRTRNGVLSSVQTADALKQKASNIQSGRAFFAAASALTVFEGAALPNAMLQILARRETVAFAAAADSLAIERLLARAAHLVLGLGETRARRRRWSQMAIVGRQTIAGRAAANGERRRQPKRHRRQRANSSGFC